MKPLVVLLIVFALSAMVIKYRNQKHDLSLAARIALAVMLIFTSIGHFLYTQGMAMMLPEFIPNKTIWVQATGFIEIAAAIGLLIPKIRVLTARLLILFFILILPANIYAAMQHIDLEKGNFEGQGPDYLWFRIPLQIVFITWTYLSAIRK